MLTSPYLLILPPAVETEGLFRIPGQKDRIDEMVKDFEDDDDIRFYMHETDLQMHHNVACLLKRFLRELEEPIIPFTKYDEFLKLGGTVSIVVVVFGFLLCSLFYALFFPCLPCFLPRLQHPTTHFLSHTTLHHLPSSFTEYVKSDEEEMKEKLPQMYRECVGSIPDINQWLLQYLMEFFSEVAAHADKNKMKASNIAIIMSPNVVKAKDETAEILKRDSKARTASFLYLLNHIKEIFPEKLVLGTIDDELDAEVEAEALVGGTPAIAADADASEPAASDAVAPSPEEKSDA